MLLKKVANWGEFGIVARQMITNSYVFLQDVCGFLTTEVDEMNKEKGMETEAANWLYVSHVLRQIFEELHLLRQFGIEANPAVQAWCALQAWKLQERIRGNGIRTDPIVETVFNQYIKDSVVSKSVYLKEREEHKTEMAAMHEKMDRVLRTVQTLQSSRGGGKEKK